MDGRFGGMGRASGEGSKQLERQVQAGEGGGPGQARRR